MQGVLIVSTDPAVRHTLHHILQPGKTVHERNTVTEALELAAAQRFDFVFLDDQFPDGNAHTLAQRLHRLGYTTEMVPLLLYAEAVYTEPFRRFGIRYFLTKPFDVDEVRRVADQIEHAVSRQGPAALPAAAAPTANGGTAAETRDPAPSELDTREIARRFQRILSHSLDRDELLRCFADNLQEQLDVDNVVLLLPAPDAAEFRVHMGNVTQEVRQQFFLPFEDPLLAALARRGEPVDVNDPSLDRESAPATQRYGERLGVALLCPVLVQGSLRAIIGLSRSHRYGSAAAVQAMLRLFLPAFARALHHAERHNNLVKAETAFRTIVQALPEGTILVDGSGLIRCMNHAAAHILKITADEFLGRPIERLDSRLAGIARDALAGEPGETALLELRTGSLEVSATGSTTAEGNGAVLAFRTAEPREETAETPAPETAEDSRIWTEAAETLAHNFKNALVPVKTCAQLLPERFEDREFRDSFFALTQENLGKVDGWIQQLMRFAHVGNGETRTVVFPLHEALEDGLQAALEEVHGRDIEIAREYDEDPVEGNRQLTEQIFCELVRNALAAMEDSDNPRLRLRTQALPGTVQASVIDNGCGFDDQTRSQAFVPFTSGKLSGLGLGLPFVEKAIRKQQGSAEILPAFERGSCVQITLPRAPAPARDTDEKPAETVAQSENSD